MFGRLATSYPRRVIAAAILSFLGLAFVAAGAMDALSLSRFESDSAESAQAEQLLADRFHTGTSNIAVLVTAESGTVDNAAVVAAGRQLTDLVARYPGVEDAWSFWTASGSPTLASEDRTKALVLAWAPGDADEIRKNVLPGLEAALTSFDDTAAGVRLQLGGSDQVFRAVSEQSRTDFLRAEMLILPLVIGLLWLVFRRWALALVTFAIGLFSVVATLAVLRVVAALTEVSTFAANIALVMGIALGVDYGLFLIFRFREEMQRTTDTGQAVRAALAVAGRTIVFSGATVAASLAVLFVFPFPFLSSFAYAGIAVVATAIVGATVILPAALTLLGTRALRRRNANAQAAPSDGGRWGRLARTIMRRPIVGGGVGLLVLIALGAPAMGVDFGAPDDRILPASQPVRALYDTIRTDFRTEDADAIAVVAPGSSADAVDDYAARLSRVPGVQRVDFALGSYTEGTPEPTVRGDRFVSDSGTGTWLEVIPTRAQLDSGANELVDQIRSVPTDFTTLVGGSPAMLEDYTEGVRGRLAVAGVLIALITFAVLFLMTGSVIAPLKATVLNLLSLSVMFGVLVWGFQEGNLSGLVGFTPTGTIEASIPILMFCIAYGLSMDYEVFLLSRIKEEFDRTGDYRESVVWGIARSAPLVSAAALILAASFALYATSGVVFLQQLGIGMALAVLVDATIVRGVLVPAFMRLAGPWNWWAPAPLRRLHNAIGLHENPIRVPVATDVVSVRSK
ncbi:RND superfamily putative drug exporter [Nocardia tenerifensis]|uniref:RND superfamily putative drug exporter n=1 Tax=Nocardia tenerifensis TaxID=228006 RepID=A0A318KLY1_9NOCA|nr:MMPL family transporter [Nocardia tenerifensis]PXX70660.1 RND superfamily putative drug exporter [Nocardia tenerifensis]